MFTSIYLHNYKTFTDTTIDLSLNNKVKNLVLLYGENGAGKSNFASVFFCFAELIRTMDVRDIFQELMEKHQETANMEDLMSILKSRFRDVEAIIKEAKTIGAGGNIILDFSFIINNKRGRYLIEMGETEIVHERLEYVLEKNKGVYFDIIPGKTKLNEKVFLNTSIQNDITENIKRFWGKHSLLAIIHHEFIDKSRKFLEDAFSEHFRNCLNDFYLLSCRIRKPESPQYEYLGLRNKMLSQLSFGHIGNEDLKDIDKIEKMLNLFLPSINSSIKEVFYKKKKKEKIISYRLYTKQFVSGKLVDIPFSLESTGTHNILELLPFFLNVVRGYTVVIDEFDSGIHDLLVKYIIEDIVNEYSGQIIITTHNTLVMSSNIIPSSSFYTIENDKEGNRKIESITDSSDKRVHPNHNKQSRYIDGKYKAIPDKIHIAIKELDAILD